MDENLPLVESNPLTSEADFSPPQYFEQPELPSDPQRRRSVSLAGKLAIAGALVGIAAGTAIGVDAMGSGSHESHAAAVASQSPTQAESVSPSISVENTNTPSSLPKITTSPSATAKTSPSSQPTSETSKQPTLLPYQELPGYGKEVSAANVERVKAASVEVLMRYSGSTNPGDWVPNCMGTKISIGGKDYILSSAHCLDIPNDSPNKKAHAVDVTNNTGEQYGVRSANDLSAPVVALSRTVEGQVDMTLQQIDPKDPHIAVYNQIPAIPYDNPMDTFNGTPVDLKAEAGSLGSGSAITTESHNKLISNPRVYLGRIQDPAQAGVYVDVWGENVVSRATDSCNFGSSGSSSLSADGWFSGPETWRNYISSEKGGNVYPDESNALSQQFKDGVDLALGFSTKNFNLLCGTSVINQTIVHNAVAVFDTPPAVTN